MARIARNSGEPAAGAAGTIDALWTQRQAAAYLGVSDRYVRDSDCPKLLLPGTGPKGKPLVRYVPDEVRAWALAHRAARRFA